MKSDEPIAETETADWRLAKIRAAIEPFAMLNAAEKNKAAQSIFDLTKRQGAEDRYARSDAFLNFHGKVMALVARFAQDGLTLEYYVKKAALKQPPLFCQSPDTIEKNIRGVVKAFASEGLTTETYLQAALKQPQLFCQSLDTIEKNIRGVVKAFASEGLTTETYLQAALKQPQLFYRSPDTIEKNICGVVKAFASEGLTTETYLQAALKQPPLFCQSPDTIIRHIHGFMGLYAIGLLEVKPDADWPKSAQHPHKPVLGMLLKTPNLLCLADENILLRAITAALDDRPLHATLLVSARKPQIQQMLRAYVQAVGALPTAPEAEPEDAPMHERVKYRAQVLLTAIAQSEAEIAQHVGPDGKPKKDLHWLDQALAEKKPSLDVDLRDAIVEKMQSGQQRGA